MNKKLTKKKFLLYILFSLYSIFITIYSFIMLFSIYESKYESKKNTNILSQQKDCIFLVKIINGKISIFQKNKKNSILTLEKNPTDLPEYDNKLLKNGIYLYSINQLNKLIEDYED